jgi:Na+-driven multidrug efflux pump
MTGAGGRRSRTAILEGPVGPTLFGLAWPMAGMLVLDQSQVFLTALFAGRLIEGDSLAALAVMSPVLLVLSLVTGALHVGVQVLVARSGGRGDGHAIPIVVNGLYMSMAWGVAVTLFALWQLPSLASALAGDLDIAKDLESYFLPWSCFYSATVIAGVVMFAVTGTGWTRFALGRSVAALALMLALVPIFVNVLGLGLAGLSLSDGISDTLLLVLACVALYKFRNDLELGPWRREHWRPDTGLWWRILSVGAPYQLARVTAAVAQIAMVRVLMTSNDADLVAGYGIAMLVIMMVLGLAGGCISAATGIMVGQNAGAGNLVRAKQSLGVALRWTAGLGVAVIVLTTFAEPVYGSFTDDPETVSHADSIMSILRWAVPASLVNGVLLRSYTALAANKLGNFVATGCSLLAIAAVLVLPGNPVELVTAVAVASAYVQLALVAVITRRAFAR